MHSTISRNVGGIRRQNYGIIYAHVKAYKSTAASQAQGTGNELQEPHIGAKIQPKEDIQPAQSIGQVNDKDNKLVYNSYWGIAPTGIKERMDLLGHGNALNLGKRILPM